MEQKTNEELRLIAGWAREMSHPQDRAQELALELLGVRAEIHELKVILNIILTGNLIERREAEIRGRAALVKARDRDLFWKGGRP